MRPAIACALLGAGLAASACTTSVAPRQSALQEQIGTTVSASELRIRVYELADRLAGILEQAADEIRSKSTDPAVRRRALLWKADGIPALYAAAFRPDPLMGALDLWVLMEQMDLYFSEGAGKAAFGAEQPIARAATRRMLELGEHTGEIVAVSPETLANRKAAVQKYAREHPIENGFSGRPTAASELVKYLDAQDRSALAAVGQATDTLADMTLRLNSYSTLLPKEIRWQGELLTADVVGRENLSSALKNLDEIGRVARRASDMMSDVPGTMSVASAPIREMVEEQRVELLAALDEERRLLTQFITEERKAALDTIRLEREAAFESVAKERAAALQEIDAISKRSLDAAAERARTVVNYVFWRFLFLLALSAAFVLAVMYFRRRRAPDRAETRLS